MSLGSKRHEGVHEAVRREGKGSLHLISVSFSVWGLEECLNLKTWEIFVQRRLAGAPGQLKHGMAQPHLLYRKTRHLQVSSSY